MYVCMYVCNVTLTVG